MNTFLTIANRDFKSYFYSIKGWAVFWFALFFTGMFFWSFVATYIELNQQSVMPQSSAPELNQLLTAIFHNLHFILLLIVPAISMTSFAEERKSQTLRLLQCSPITTFQIVLGKFFACFSVLSLVLIATMIYPLYTIIFGTPDLGQIFSSYLGLFLLMSGQAALGLWISSLCKNQFLAFLFTMGGVFFLMILNWIAPNLAENNGLEGAVKYLATTTHLDQLFKGLITTADISYFLIFTIFFIYLTYVSIDSLRWR